MTNRLGLELDPEELELWEKCVLACLKADISSSDAIAHADWIIEARRERFEQPLKPG